MLEALTCGQAGSSQLQKLLLVPEEQQPVLQAYAEAMCGGGAGDQRSERFRRMSLELREQISKQEAAEKVRSGRRRGLLVGGASSDLLPSSTQLQLQQPRPGPPEHHLRTLLRDLAGVERLLKDVDLLSGLARLLPAGACRRAASASPSNLTWPLGNSTWSANTTDDPREAGEDRVDGGGGGAKEQPENPQFSAFVQLWATLQPILCGNDR